ncbi:MAG: monovalent cation/H(+) antiporter subunit G [Deltaproteobacteria bacterium]|jgi:multicomponent Na+:H+ antiporter subunit G|nr:monovalent cation/H(+) antiporter subunit G [Deltaproteobacteria bacterium]
MNILIIVLLITGLFLFFATTVGLLRFPDFYSRMHAAGKGDTLSSLLMLFGLTLYEFHELNLATVLVGLKILLIMVFIFMASPTATHAITDAGYESGVKPWQKEKKEEAE